MHPPRPLRRVHGEPLQRLLRRGPRPSRRERRLQSYLRLESPGNCAASENTEQPLGVSAPRGSLIWVEQANDFGHRFRRDRLWLGLLLAAG